MTSADRLREDFLSFFERKGHKRLPGSSLVPKNDPTLLLTGAGMVQFKPYFLGLSTPTVNRVTTCQPCLRTPDIERVGKTARHCTFFEMLGNFSFGDYFKAEAIEWAWEFVTGHLRLDPERLWVSVYLDDDEAAGLWQEKAGVPPERIVRLGKEDNFWEIGVGPCGPCSEIYVDRGRGYGCGSPDCGPACNCDRFMEIWNLVFIQFHKDEAGEYHLLEKKSIDTGMGLERLAVIMQGVNNVFETDLLRPVMTRVEELSGRRYGVAEEDDVALRVVTEHARGVTFMAKDGILPGNEGRGYVMRRLIRRALRYGRRLGLEESFLPEVADRVIERMGAAYPDLVEKRTSILATLRQEEDRFQATLEQGMAILAELTGRPGAQKERRISGEDAFRLYDTYGFPLELTREIAAEQGFTVDEDGFRAALDAQRERARAARGEGAYLDRSAAIYARLAERLGAEGTAPTAFSGYDRTEDQGVVAALLQGGEEVTEASAGAEVEVVLTRTPFYAESGGQVADEGILVGPAGRVEVAEARRPAEGLVVHRGLLVEGRLRLGDEVRAAVDAGRRLATARNHTATHLVHRALRLVLGEHATQAGSLVAPDRLRFDFAHYSPVPAEQLRAVERIVNAKVREDLPVTVEVTTREEAEARGAVALFGEKYGKDVRVVEIGDFSRELCGGTHVRRTGELGFFKIVSEGGVAAGVRRIEAVTGEAAEEHLLRQADLVAAAADRLKVTPDLLVERLEKLVQERHELGREVETLRARLVGDAVEELLQEARELDGLRVVVGTLSGLDPEGLRQAGDRLRQKLGEGVVILGSAHEGRALLLAMTTPGARARGVHAGDLVKAAAAAVGGGGGGRPEMAQAGGKSPERLPEALAAAEEVLRKQVHHS
ncbi:MAG: alanine--tRNA ligase [Bacillota bacterium]|nr:alanine--tRNA ligase [Bacillota bacterium]